MPPCWSVPGGSLSLAALVAITPWPQPPPQHQPGPQHPWGVPVAPGAPWTPTAGLWKCGHFLLPLLHMGSWWPPGPSSPLLLPAWLALSICLSRRAQLTHGLGSPPWCEQGWGPWGGGTLIPQLSRSHGITAWPQPHCKTVWRTPLLPEPACPLGAAWAPGEGWQHHPDCPAEMPRLWAPPSHCRMLLGQLPTACPMPCVGEHPALVQQVAGALLPPKTHSHQVRTWQPAKCPAHGCSQQEARLGCSLTLGDGTSGTE